MAWIACVMRSPRGYAVVGSRTVTVIALPSPILHRPNHVEIDERPADFGIIHVPQAVAHLRLSIALASLIRHTNL